MPAKPFIFICGPDDFLVNRLGTQRYDALAAAVTDEFSREVLNGFANNVAEVEEAVNRFREAVRTISLFGGQRVVWLKDVNFLADTVTGRAEGTRQQVEELQALLGRVNPEEVAVVVTAAPVDRRRAFCKWCEATADYTLVGDEGQEGAAVLEQVARAEAEAQGVTLAAGALELLLAKVGTNSRLLVEEVRKLAAYVTEGGAIEETQVAELTPNFAEGDFFEAAEAFCRSDLRWMLAALHRHFFAGGDARPVITALQNRNRLLVQLRVLIDTGAVRLGPRGPDRAGFEGAAENYRRYFAGAAERSSFNIFTQNLWYLGKLAGSGQLPPLRRLIDNQQEFIVAFEEIVRRPGEQEDVLREMAVRCLA
ncbi:MAG TPA: DNA polymerase III subunit delta [Opitutaceae bacterium]|nr:DNA polymerase III subunit delta [Opitutaceae bacterium]